MADGSARLYIRPEFEATDIGVADHGDVARALSLFERVRNINAVRKLSILVGMVVLWELYTQIGGVSELILPPFSSTGAALVQAIWTEDLLILIGNSITILLAV